MRKWIIAAVGLLALMSCADAGPGEVSVSPPDLSEGYGCGYGFYLSDAGQTAGLFIELTDFSQASSGNFPQTSQLTGGQWQARLQFGADLFSNWCDDVMEPGEPDPVVDETWTVSGLIEITGLPEAGTCGEATARLSGVTARNPGGEAMPLGDLEVINPAWGCFAG